MSVGIITDEIPIDEPARAEGLLPYQTDSAWTGQDWLPSLTNLANLVSRGVSADRLQTISYGEERPKYDNAREETRRLNRRAAMVVRLQ